MATRLPRDLLGGLLGGTRDEPEQTQQQNASHGNVRTRGTWVRQCEKPLSHCLFQLDHHTHATGTTRSAATLRLVMVSAFHGTDARIPVDMSG